MNEVINSCLTVLNSTGRGFCSYAAGIFVQSSVLIVLLLIIDFLLRKRVRAVFRYCLWMLLFVKLVLPASFTLPTGIGYWLGDYFTSEVSMAKWIRQTEEIVPTTLNIHQRSIPLGPVVTNETAVIDIYQGLIPLEPVMTNETAATGIEFEAICWQGLVFLGWLVGMLALLALLVQRVCFVRGLIAQSIPANERLLEMLEECRCQIGIRRNIKLRQSNNISGPAVCGLFKPVILIPTSLVEKLSPDKLRTVLIHELAHIKRGDVWVNLVQTILQIIYFYNPFVWLANSMVRRVREQAVDEMVLVTLKPETKSYSNMLIDIAEMAFWRPNFSLRLIGVVESKKALERRIKHMLSRPVPKSSKLGYLGLIAIVVIGAILLLMGSNSMAEAANTQKNSRGNSETRNSETKTIVPGVRVGDYTFGMSKDEVLRKLGEPESIQLGKDDVDVVRRGEERYSLNNLPSHYILSFGNISFWFSEDSIEAISVHSPLYKLSNGLGVGDSEQKIKQAFGEDFDLEEVLGKDFLCYKAKGLGFEIHKNNQTVAEIVVYEPEGARGDSDAPDQQEKSKHTIVPGLRVGAYTLDMSKDDVLKKLGEPEAIQLGEDDVDVVRRGEERYSLNNLPSHYILSFGNISFWFSDDSLEAISVRSPLYKLSNGLGVGDSEQKIKQAFGEDFHLEEVLGKDFLCYKAKGLGFEIHKKNQTVAEIVTYQPKVDRPDSAQVALVSKAAAEGRISFKRTSPEEFKEIAGEPTKEWTDGDDVIYMEYPGIEVKFVGKPETNTPHTVQYVLCERMGIDIGQDRPIDEGDLDQQPDRSSSKDVSTLVRQAAADGRISFKLTTPDEFKAIAGQPTREWTESDDDVIGMEYPGIKVKFFGKPDIKIPHTLIIVSCEGRGIDFGQNRPVVLRNEGDLDKFGTFWGYSSVDLSRLDLSQKGELLKAMPFDSRTVWPEPDLLPPDFDPKAVMEWGKYPGLGVKQLHDRGVTGKGVHVAIIDQPLLLGHIEYKDQLVSYKEIETGNADPQMHGPPVASILVGKTCGVAPGAILHYWAEPSWKGDYKYRCIALEQIIRYNREKTKSEQIRIVSVSKGFSQSEPNLDRWKTLLEKAKQSGIYVVHCSSMGFGAGCRFLKDSDNPASYRLCAFYQGGPVYRQSGTFFTPIDHRTTASHRARDAYTFWTRGGLSWGAPYYAGVVALGMQVNPDLSVDQIDKLIYESGWDFQRGKLINPMGFVKAARHAID